MINSQNTKFNTLSSVILKSREETKSELRYIYYYIHEAYIFSLLLHYFYLQVQFSTSFKKNLFNKIAFHMIFYQSFIANQNEFIQWPINAFFMELKSCGGV